MSVDAATGWLIVVAVVAVYAAVVFALYRAGRIGPDRSLSLLGPALMIKTRRGRSLLDRVGRFARFWSAAGDLGVLLAAVAMVTITLALVLGAVVALRVPASAAPSPAEALGIPGINPIIPIGYGLVALIVGVVLHELAHGVVARSQKIGVKSLGVLWCVIPVGAFVEQDDAEMNAAPRRNRDRVAAAGVLANFGLAVLFFLLLAGMVTTSVQPNANGVGIAYVVPGTPAANASLVGGDIILDVNGTPTTTNAALIAALSNSTPGRPLELTLYDPGSQSVITRSVTPTNLSSYTGNPADRSKGFLGVSVLFLTPAELKTDLVAPYNAPGGALIGSIDWIVLPIAGVEPMGGGTTVFFHVTGPLAALGTGNFWVLANLLYWLAWMNLLLGLSNSLPLIPLDGGLLIRDFASSIAHRLRKGWDGARLDRFGGRAAAITSLIVFVLILWPFVVPRL